MRRTSLMLLGAGAGLLVVSSIVLLQAVQSGSSSAATTPSSRDEGGETASPSPSPTTPAAPGKRASLPAAVKKNSGPTAQGTIEAQAAPTLENAAPPATRGNTKNLHFGGTQLRAQTKAVEPLVAKCIESDIAAGHSPTGSATLTYVVAKKGETVVVEDTSYDADKTSLDGDLLECLHKTSRSMVFEGLPREAEGLVVTRSVSVDHGKLVENKHVGFSYLR